MKILVIILEVRGIIYYFDFVLVYFFLNKVIGLKFILFFYICC